MSTVGAYKAIKGKLSVCSGKRIGRVASRRMSDKGRKITISVADDRFDAHASLQKDFEDPPVNEARPAADRKKVKIGVGNLLKAIEGYGKKKEELRLERDLEELDEMGTKLFNNLERAILLADQEGGDLDVLMVALTYRLISLSMPGVEGGENEQIRLLGIITSTCHSLHNCREQTISSFKTALVAHGDQIEAALQLHTSVDRQDSFKMDKVTAILRFGLLKLVMAVDEGKGHAASVMIGKCNDLEAANKLCPDDCALFATTCWEIGTKLAERAGNATEKPDTTKESLSYIRAGMRVIRGMEIRFTGQLPHSTRSIKAALLRTQARILVRVPDAPRAMLEKAGATLRELVQIMDYEDAKEVLEVRGMQFRIHARYAESAADLDPAVEDFIRAIDFSSSNVELAIIELSALQSQTPNAPDMIMRLLYAALANPAGHPHVAIILLSDIVALTKASQTEHIVDLHDRVKQAVEAANRQIDFSRLNTSQIIACESLIWEMAARRQQQGVHAEAGRLYGLAGHELFERCGSQNMVKCRRKSALCYILAGEFTNAQVMLDKCDPTQAATQYLLFVLALHQSRNEASIAAINNLLECPDANGQHVVLMVSAAQKQPSTTILLSSLQAVLKASQMPLLGEVCRKHSVMVINSLVQLQLVRLAEDDDKEPIAAKIIETLNQAFDLLQAYPHVITDAPGEAAVVYQIAHRAAIEASTCTESGTFASLFDVSARLMQLHQSVCPDAPATLNASIATAMFACLSGQVFRARETNSEDRSDLFMMISNYIPLCRDAMSIASTMSADKVSSMLGVLHVLAVECFCEVQDWDSAMQAVQEAASPDSAGDAKLLASLVDPILGSTHCPPQVMTHTLNAVLNFLQVESSETANQFASWARMLLTLLLPAQPTTALDVMRCCLDIKTGPHGRDYPDAEVSWLFATSFQQGQSLLRSKNIDLGRAWLELAMELMPFDVALVEKERTRYHTHYQYLLQCASSVEQEQESF